MLRLPPRSTPLYSSAASDVYKRQLHDGDEVHVGFRLARDETVQVIEVGLVMLAVMETDRVLRDEGLERVVGPGKRRKNHGRRSFRDRGKARVVCGEDGCGEGGGLDETAAAVVVVFAHGSILQ